MQAKNLKWLMNTEQEKLQLLCIYVTISSNKISKQLDIEITIYQ